MKNAVLIWMLVTVALGNVAHGFVPQRVSGTVVSQADGKGASGVIVRLYVGSGLKSFGKTDGNGRFSVKDFPADSLKFLRFLSPEFETKDVVFTDASDSLRVELIPKVFELPEVTAKVPHTRVKGDTISYDVASFTNLTDRSIEDVIKKLPGIEVEENGRIIYDGEPINHFYIEGMDLMGNNYAVASRNIRPEDISTVSVYQRHQAKRVLKDVQSSNRAALNLKLKNKRLLKPIGHLKGGAGGGDGTGTLWAGDLYAMEVAPTFQATASVKGNNTGSTYITPTSGSLERGLFSQLPFGKPSLGGNRFWDNESFSASVNGLIKLKSGMQLKANASYALESKNFTGEESTDYVGIDDPSIANFRETTFNDLLNRRPSVALQAEQNLDNFYFLDKLAFQSEYSDNGYAIDHGVPTNQSIRNKRLNFSNSLNAIVKKKGRLFDLKSQTRLSSSPGSEMTFTTSADPSGSGRQRLDARSIHNSESFGVMWGSAGKFKFGTDADFSFDRQTLRSEGEGFALINGRSDNDVSGHKLQADVAPKMVFTRPGRVSVELSIPLKLTSTSYRSRTRTTPANDTRMNVDLDGMWFYKFNNRNNLDGTFGIENTLGEIKDFITNPIQTAFRAVTVPGTGELGESRRSHASVAFVQRSFVNPHNLRVGLKVSRTEKNTSYASDVSGSGVLGSVMQTSSTTDMASSNVAFTKNFIKANILVGGNASGTWMKTTAFRNGNEMKVLNSIYTLSGNVQTHHFDDRLNTELMASVSLSRQDFHGKAPGSKLTDSSLRGKLEVVPFGKLVVTGRANFSWVQVDAGLHKANVFIDCGARWTERRWEAELVASNLTGLRDYTYKVYNSLSVTTYSFGLRPLELQAILKINF